MCSSQFRPPEHDAGDVFPLKARLGFILLFFIEDNAQYKSYT